ncbi:MAG: DNA replication/repair protein RecF [bacterium]
MNLDLIELLNYRNYSHTTLEFSPYFNVLTGPNGSGKTNLLEAIHLLANGEVKRGRRDAEAIKWNETFSWIRGEVSYEDGRIVKLVVQINSNGKDFSINGKIKTLKEYIGTFSVVSIFEDDEEIISGDPDKRREFLDKFIISIEPSYYSLITRYRNVLVRRNRLLKEGTSDKRLIEALTEILLKYGGEIIRSRDRFISIYNEYLARECKRIGFSIEIDIPEFSGDIEEKVSIYRKRFEASRKKEEVIGATLVGPHRDEVVIKMDGKDSRSFASNGESRIIVFLIKLTQWELIRSLKKYKPIFVVDEFLNKLDRNNVNLILEIIEEKSPQVFLSELVDIPIGKKGIIFSIEKGEILNEKTF